MGVAGGEENGAHDQGGEGGLQSFVGLEVAGGILVRPCGGNGAELGFAAGGLGGREAPELVVGGGGRREIAALPGDGRELEGGGDVAWNRAKAGDEGFAAKGHALDDGEVGPLVVAFPERERGAIEECAGEEAEPNGE